MSKCKNCGFLKILHFGALIGTSTVVLIASPHGYTYCEGFEEKLTWSFDEWYLVDGQDCKWGMRDDGRFTVEGDHSVDGGYEFTINEAIVFLAHNYGITEVWEKGE